MTKIGPVCVRFMFCAAVVGRLSRRHCHRIAFCLAFSGFSFCSFPAGVNSLDGSESDSAQVVAHARTFPASPQVSCRPWG